MQYKFRNFTAVLAGIFIALTVSCSNSSSSQSDHDFYKLCTIYEEIAPKDISSASKGMELSEKIQKELPNFYKNNYQHLVNVDRGSRYKIIKDIAEKATNKDWDCAAMESYFAGKYDKKD